jgi:hypothetical protein
VLIAVCLVLVAAFIGWALAGREAGRRVQRQLTELQLGSVQTGLSRVTMAGVNATNIRFTRDGEAEPWLIVGSLQIQEPLVQLAAGSEDYDQITLSDVVVHLDADELLSAMNSESKGFDLASLELPSDHVVLKNAIVRITQPGRKELVVGSINANLDNDGEESLQLSASLQNWLGANWNVSGEVRKSRNEVDLRAEAEGFHLPTDWQKLPGLPANLEQYLDASGAADVVATVEVRDRQSLHYRAVVSPKQVNLRLPAFDLDLKVNNGHAIISDGRVDLKQIAATANGTETISIDGSGRIDSFPVEVQFGAAFDKLSINTVRKIVPAIPVEVGGRATGNANGAVSVSELLETSLELTTVADNVDATFGKLEAGPSTTNVNLRSLRLSSGFEVLDLQGNVMVQAVPEKQSTDQIFETFQLEDLQHQLNVKAEFDATLDLTIPLSTADQLETWQLEIKAESDEGLLDEQQIEQIRALVRLDRGSLLFDDLTAQVPGSTVATNSSEESQVHLVDNGRISLKLDWPLTRNARHADHGRLLVSAESLPADWALAVGQSQIQTANDHSRAKHLKQPDARSRHASVRRKNNQPWVDPAIVNGLLNADAEIRIDAAQPDNVRLWQLEGVVSDSVLGADIEQLQQLEARIDLRNGQLTLDQFNGKLPTGSIIEAAAKLDVITGELSVAELSSDALPLTWLLETAKAISPEAESYLQSAGIQLTGQQKNISGRVAVDVELASTTAPDETSSDAEGWQFNVQAKAKKLTVGRRTIEGLELNGSIDQRQIFLEQFSAKAGMVEADRLALMQGDLQADGRWDYIDRKVAGQISWTRTPIRWVAGWIGSDAMALRGTTSGSLNLSSTEQPRAFPAEVQGRISFNRLGLDNRFRTSVDLLIETNVDTNQLIVKSVGPANGGVRDFDLQAALSILAPYDFSGSVMFDSLSLRSITESIDSLVSPSMQAESDQWVIGGVITGEVAFGGQLQDLQWTTDGALSVIKPSVASQQLSDIEANWDLDSRNFATSTGEFELLGGQIKMVETIANPQRIRISIDGLEADQLSALAGPSFPVLEGQLSGEASINQWEDPELGWADLRLEGATSRIVGVRLSDLGASIEYKQQKLNYVVAGRALAGTIAGQGSASVDVDDLRQVSFPLELKVDKAQLQRLAFESNRYQSLKQLSGAFSAQMLLAYDLQTGFVGTGRVRVASVNWNNQLLTRVASADVRVRSGVAELDNVQADLRRGKISGRAVVPLAGVASGSALGSYQVNIQQFDLERLLDVAMPRPPEASGFFDARLTGQLGQTINGRGTVGFHRARIYGVAADSLKVPVQFRFDPARLTGRVEVRQSTIRALHGRITGEAAVDFGRTMNVDVDLNLSRIDTADLLAAIDPFSGQNQGELSGQLVLRGRSVSRPRDLKGSFKGSLDRARAFRVPLLNDIGNVIGGGQINGGSYDSDQIDIRLANGRVAINNFQLESSLARIAIGGNAYLDGRLDLAVAARIENLGSANALDQLVKIPGPLAVLQLSPVTQAADFLSGRSVFAKVGGTISRPNVRLDGAQQLRAEAARYFLRGPQILPNSASPND